MVNEFEEFRKQYENTYIRIQFENSNTYNIVKVVACIADDPQNSYITLHNPVLGQLSVSWNKSKQKIDYTFPAVGLFNHGNSFLMFHRFPDRQWKRGVTVGNSHIADPLRDIKLSIASVRPYTPRSVELSYSVLCSAYNQHYPINLKEAIKVMASNEGIALNDVFGITQSPIEDNQFVLWKHLSMIGFVYPKSSIISVREDSFLQEVSDFLKRQQEYAWTLQ